MSHILSVSELKRGYRKPNSRDLPKEGTLTHSIYDLLMKNKGKWVDYTIISPILQDKCRVGQMMSVFRNTYGLDIRNGRDKWLLAGEWINDTYVDFVAQRLCL